MPAFPTLVLRIDETFLLLFLLIHYAIFSFGGSVN